jgi:NAD(P)-dependent dehydrogenase (short-subunit alcohol dehydrogenase family)
MIPAQDPAFADALFALTFGRLDILFNHAGIDAPPALLEDLPMSNGNQAHSGLGQPKVYLFWPGDRRL